MGCWGWVWRSCLRACQLGGDLLQPLQAEQLAASEMTKAVFQGGLAKSGFGEITTEIAAVGTFYYAEPYHQQYLAENPNGYCGLGGTGVACPIGLATTSK